MDGKTDESELLQASAAGDKEAFGLVVQRYQSLICALTYSATGDVATSEDLAQETFIRAWKKLRQLESPGKFRAWLCTIARNLTHTAARRRSVASPLEDAQTQPATTPGPDEIASETERRQIVWDAVGRIEPKYREPLILYYRCGQSIRDVADNLDLSEDAVRQRLHRGRQFIKTEISSLVEDTLSHSGPAKTFAVIVVAALPALITPPASAAVAGVIVKSTPVAKTAVGTGLAGVSFTTVMAWVGALLGPVLGVLCGAFGSWRGIKNTKSPRERQFMIRMTVLIWILVAALIGVPLALLLMHAIPRWAFSVCLWSFFGVLVPLSHWSNARQRRIQDDDGTYQAPPVALRPITKASMYAMFAGVIFGPTSWLIFLAGVVDSWIASVVILCCDIVLFVVVTKMFLRRQEQIWTGVLVVVSSLAVMTLAVVNLYWNDWMAIYRESSLYDPTNDISLKSINLMVAAAYLAMGLPLWYVYLKGCRQAR